VIRSNSDSGLVVVPTAPLAATSLVSSTVHANTGSGIYVGASGAGASITIKNVVATNNYDGVQLGQSDTSSISVTLRAAAWPIGRPP
jgi:hypothetical protein